MQKRELLLSSSRKSIERQPSQATTHLHSLVDRLERISSSIQIDTNSKNFKFFEMDKQTTFKDDPHTLLRNLQNKSEINRAQIQLLSQRRPKHYSIKQARQQGNTQQSYLSIYRRLKHEKVFKDKNDTELTSEEEILEGAEQGMKGVKHFTQLRQHPRLLQYTLERLRDKSEEVRQETRKAEGKEQLRQASRPFALQNPDYKEIIELNSNWQDPLESPKAIVDNQMTKFYSKSSKGKLEVKIKENPRCMKLLERQEQLVTRLEDNSISKENMKKLKERLNIIVNEISKSDKLRSADKLPKITPFHQDTH